MKVLPARRPIGWVKPTSTEEKIMNDVYELRSRGYDNLRLFMTYDFYQTLINEFDKRKYIKYVNFKINRFDELCGLAIEIKPMAKSGYLVFSDEKF
jgi:hypothetical protein